MFSVLFEVQPKPDQWDAYLGIAKMLKPELEQIDGFIDNVRYRSLARGGWIFSLSSWRDEKALVRWRIKTAHHNAQEKGRNAVLSDYHLRVGQLTQDTRLPAGCALDEQRLDETQSGAATTVTLIDAQRDADWVKQASASDVAKWLGLQPDATGLVTWDVFDAVLTPGDIILMMSWRSSNDAKAFASTARLHQGSRLRTVRVVRDYGMYERHEAPQYYPEVTKPA